MNYQLRLIHGKTGDVIFLEGEAKSGSDFLSKVIKGQICEELHEPDGDVMKRQLDRSVAYVVKTFECTGYRLHEIEGASFFLGNEVVNPSFFFRTKTDDSAFFSS